MELLTAVKNTRARVVAGLGLYILVFKALDWEPGELDSIPSLAPDLL